VLFGLTSLSLSAIIVGDVSHAAEDTGVASLKRSESIKLMISQGKELAMDPALPEGSIGCSTSLSWSQQVHLGISLETTVPQTKLNKS
jgi:hypothetical protein